MSEEKKCCGCCQNKELNNEELDKVSGGSGSWQKCTEQNGKFICPNKTCNLIKTVDGIANVCTCSIRRNTAECKECRD